MKEEIYKIIEDNPNYMISNMGNVKSLNYNRTGEEKLLKQQINKNGYPIIRISNIYKHKITLYVHQLVAKSFLPNPNNYPCVNHKNEVKTDNRVDNLEYCTKQYNNIYGTRNERIGKALKGKNMTETQNIKQHNELKKPIVQYDKNNKLIGIYESAKQASELLGISKTHISNVCKGKRNFCGGFRWVFLEDYLEELKKAG